MKKTMKATALVALALLATSACTRRVQVESEPNRPEYRMEQTSAVAADADTETARR